ncbi:MAG: hypothetical protein IKM39_04495 [Clostridia bacterium]|nr:hypothetical protein [Clostridia bacterium]
MKRTIVVFLVASLLMAFLPTYSVFGAIEPLLFSACDSATTWVNGSYPATEMEVDYQNFTQGIGSIRYTGTLAKGTSLVMYTNFHEDVDISAYTHLEFDLYVNDKDVLESGVGQVELSSSGGCDVAELAFSSHSYMEQIKKEGWNHISLPIDSGSKNSTDPTRIFDPAKVNFFRLYLVRLNSAKESYSFNIDNLYFSNGAIQFSSGPKPSTYSAPSPCKNNGYTYGDVNKDATINSQDALACLKYAVDKVYFTNMEFAIADVDGSGKVDAADALEILKVVVKKQQVFSLEEKETLPEQVEVGINGSHLVHTQYPTDSRVIAETDVIYWGAVGDGITDDTRAFRSALAYVERLGGGTVFVPAGKYVIQGNLVIANGVTLQGDSPKAVADAPVEGTVLLAYPGRGNADGTAFISMDSASALANLSVFYPEQTMGDITPYPFTIRQVGHYGMALTNIRLVNSYQGICMGPSNNSLQNIRNVVGTPLKMGLILDHNVDICRVENVTFTPDCWINSGLSSAKDHYALTRYLYDNGTAFQFERVDWTYIADIAAKGYHIALKNCKPTMREAEESPNGHVYGVNFTDCYIGYDGEFVNTIGMMITQGTIQAEIPVRLSSDFSAEVSLNRMTLATSLGAAVVMEGGGVLSLENCTIIGKETGVDLQEGTLLCNRVTFNGVTTQILPGEHSQATLTNCQSDVPFDFGGSGEKVLCFEDEALETAAYDPENYNYNAPAVPRPAGDEFADITKEPYFADQIGNQDIGEVLQAALQDVAEKGGGVVYVPAGRYRLDSPITIPTGVELRGSATVPQHSHALSTTFYTVYGEGGDETTTALFSLSPASGMAGFKVYYDEQPGGLTDCQAYAFTVRGRGNNNYVMNVDFINSYYQMDFNTNRCDGHYINGVTGYPLEQGIVVGGGSVNGIVRDCQFNIHYFTDNPVYKTLAIDGDSAREYATHHSEAYVVKNTTHQIMYHNFVLGVHSGIAIDEGADVFVLAHGTDGGDRAMTVRGTPSGDIVFVNTQLVVIGPGNTMAYINVEPSFTGRVDMTQTNFWGQPTDCSVLLGGGRLYLSQGNNVRSGTIGVKVWNGAQLTYHSFHHLRSDLQYDLYLQDAGDVISYGNVSASGGLLFDSDSAYKGNDF